MGELTLSSYLVIAPEIALLVLLFVVLGYGSFSKAPIGRISGLIAAWGGALILLLTTILAVTAWEDTQDVLWGGMVVYDEIGVVFRVMFLIALILTTMFSLDTKNLAQPEFFALLIAATIGFNFMAMSADMIMVLVSLETASISLYLLAGYVTKDGRSAEAGMKYFIYGAFASAVMLYGMSLLYGATGESNIYAIAQSISLETAGLAGSADLLRFNNLILIAAVMLVAGFGFKVSVVPFHWWAPDVYEGAPVPVTGFASTASKAAGFAVFIRVFTAGAVGMPVRGTAWWSMLVAICVITMLLGNLFAIFQPNIKRMLAYSSVAQAGYVLIGLVSLPETAAGINQSNTAGFGAAMFYLLMYVITNLAAFGVITLVSNHTGSDDMKDLYGLSRRSPYLALAMLFALLSLGGIPPTAGFFGKFFIFRAAIEAGLWQLALAGILLAFISLYYYLNVIKYIYLYRGEEDENGEIDESPIPVSRAAKLALVLSVVGIVYLGIFAGPAFEWTLNASQWFFPG